MQDYFKHFIMLLKKTGRWSCADGYAVRPMANRCERAGYIPVDEGWWGKSEAREMTSGVRHQR